MRKKILVVDDDVDFNVVISSMLHRAGFEVETSRFAGNVLQRLLNQDVDLVVLDYMMPEQKGDQISQNIRSMPTLKQLPIIIVTGRTEMNEEYFKKMGVNEVIYKPVNYDELIEKIRKYLPLANP